MRHFKITIAYDGTDFHGWQIQSSDKPTIQGEISSVLRRLTQENVMLNGAGRTDAGVHALGQVASFRTQSGLSAGEFQRALNALLPASIRIVGAEEVGPDFHARWSALEKIYRYRLYRGKVVPPAIWRYVLHYPFPLDEDAMRIAASRYVGPHDFAAFAASTGSEDDDKERSTVREIYASDLVRSEDGEELVYTVLDVGRGKLVPNDIPRLYQLRDRSKSGPTVPPQGLCMVRVMHDEPWRVGEL
jgi:tRNA pseudouridine38-40 synthase